VTYERLLRPYAELPEPDGSTARVPEVYRLTFEPLETLSYVAALTKRIKLGTGVVDALLHPPVVPARRFATLDQFSGGRVIAGVGRARGGTRPLGADRGRPRQRAAGQGTDR
jgi:alkanesulfonate monooxygenase SsuD/methylene tetrahydromethanopterin reductase-like flavin-dependent oxidoreductase (luciferase family)